MATPITLPCGCVVNITCCVSRFEGPAHACYPNHYAAGLWKVYPTYGMEFHEDCHIPYHHRAVTEFYLEPNEEELLQFEAMGVEQSYPNPILYKVPFSNKSEMVVNRDGTVVYRNFQAVSEGEIMFQGASMTYQGPSRIEYGWRSHDGFGELAPECYTEEHAHEYDDYDDDLCHCSEECIREAVDVGCECDLCWDERASAEALIEKAKEKAKVEVDALKKAAPA